MATGNRLTGWLVMAALLAGLAGRSEFAIRDGDTVVVYGDSITDGRYYPTLIEEYVRTRFPEWKVSFVNRGVSGDSSRSVARFERDVIDRKPSFALYNMGYNDGGYDVLQSKRLEAYLANIEESVKLLRGALPETRLVLASPIPNERMVSRDPDWVSRDPYGYTMLMFGAQEKRLAGRLGVPFIDLGLEYGQTMGLGEVVMGEAFALSRDGVHPQEEGQAVIATHLLRGLGADPVVAEVTIDAAAGKTEQTAHCRVSKLQVQADKLTFERLSERLPMALPETAWPIRFLMQFDESLNRDMLVVKGLPAPGYALSIDGVELARLPAAALAEGVNLAAYDQAPEYRQSVEVMKAIHARMMAESKWWRQWIFSGKVKNSGEPVGELTAEEQADLKAGQEEIARLAAAIGPLLVRRPHLVSLTALGEAPARFAELEQSPFNAAQLKVTVAPVRVDWNFRKLLDPESGITISNRGPKPLTVRVAWESTPQWEVSMESTEVTIEGGKALRLPVKVSLKTGAEPLPPPVCRLTWQWHPDWPYPLDLSRELPVQPVLAIPYLETLPAIDGELGDAAAEAIQFELDQPCEVATRVTGKRRLWKGPDDLSASVWMGWREEGLYLALRVRDDVHVQDFDGSWMWSQDMVHVAWWVLKRGQQAGRYEFGFGLPASGPAQIKYRNTAGEVAGPPIQFVGKVLDGACTYEVLIPWAHLAPMVAESGAGFRFALSVNDWDKQPGKNFTYIDWTPGINYGKNPNDLGYILLGRK